MAPKFTCTFAASWLAGIMAVPSCNLAREDRPEFRPGRATHDITPIDITGFTQKPEIRQKILYMSFGEAAHRLGSLRFTAEAGFTFTRGGESHQQRDTYRVEQDPDGNFHLDFDTPLSQLEVFLLGEALHVRMDKGPLRHKPRREVDSEAWTEIAFSSIRQALELFRPHLAFADPQSDEVDGRPAVRYRLLLSEEATATGLPRAPVETALPVAPPARWRELARPLHLAGSLWIDAATGVMTQVRLDARMDIADRDVRPTQVTLSYRATVAGVGKVTKIQVPIGVPEYKRSPPPRDELSFFREHLPPSEE